MYIPWQKGVCNKTSFGIFVDLTTHWSILAYVVAFYKVVDQYTFQNFKKTVTDILTHVCSDEPLLENSSVNLRNISIC